MRTLKVTHGNDCYVKAYIEVKVNGGDQLVETESITLTDVQDLTIRLKNTWGNPSVIEEWAISATTENLLYFKLPGTLIVETYGLEITGTWQDRDVRYYQSEAIRIVKESEDSDLSEELYNGMTVYEYDEPIVVPFSGVIFPYLYFDLQTGYLWADHVPDGGNFSIEEGQLIATYNDEGTSW